MSGGGRSGAAALHSVRYNERSQPEVLERRSPTGIARKRETRTNNPAPRQSHDQERRSPTGIARQRETRTNDPTPHQFHAYKPTHHQPHRITGTWSAGQFSRWGPPTGIARERETRPNNAGPANLTTRSAGLRPASRGSAKPAPTTLRHANLTARSAGLQTGIAAAGRETPVANPPVAQQRP